MFNYREFLMQGFKNAIGKMADYKVIFNANGFYEKGVLTEEDLSELQKMINAKNGVNEAEVYQGIRHYQGRLCKACRQYSC